MRENTLDPFDRLRWFASRVLLAYLGRHEEVLRLARATSFVHQHLEHLALVPRIHTLVDFVHATKRDMRDVLQ